MPLSALLINKKDIRDFRTIDEPQSEVLQEEQVLVKVNKLALTANNVTYAAMGKSLRYWDFFPSQEEGWGKLPAWGFAEVIASKHSEIEKGEKLYGYFPLASQLILHAGNVNPIGFADITRHRNDLPSVYNRYVRTKNDPTYNAQFEELQSLFQPLFITSFLLEGFFSESQFFDANQIIVTSASSKTALSFAFVLSQKPKGDRPKIIGLTSSRNVEFVTDTGFYDEVIPYEKHQATSSALPTAIADFAGNIDLILNLQKHFGSNLKYASLVGAAHWDKRIKGQGSLGENAVFFFAPTQAKKRITEWGNTGFQQKLGKVWLPFLKSASQWLTVEIKKGEQAIEQTYQELVEGNINPKAGYIVSFE